MCVYACACVCERESESAEEIEREGRCLAKRQFTASPRGESNGVRSGYRLAPAAEERPPWGPGPGDERRRALTARMRRPGRAGRECCGCHQRGLASGRLELSAAPQRTREGLG